MNEDCLIETGIHDILRGGAENWRNLLIRDDTGNSKRTNAKNKILILIFDSKT